MCPLPSMILALQFGFLLVLSQSFYFVTGARSQCYYPDGSPASNAQPCKPTQVESVCCRFGWACLENPLCKTTTYSSDFGVLPQYARTSCTDSLWNSDICPKFCFGMLNVKLSHFSIDLDNFDLFIDRPQPLGPPAWASLLARTIIHSIAMKRAAAAIMEQGSSLSQLLHQPSPSSASSRVKQLRSW